MEENFWREETGSIPQFFHERRIDRLYRNRGGIGLIQLAFKGIEHSVPHF
jgi:hypothetical protein